MSSADVIPFSQNNSRASSYGLSLDRLEEMVDLETSKSTIWIIVMLACEAKPRPVLYCAELWCTVLCCTVLYCTVVYCTVLCCTVLYCAVLCLPVFTCQWDLLSVIKDGCESTTQDHPILQQLISNSTKRPTYLLWMHSILFYSIFYLTLSFLPFSLSPNRRSLYEHY